jgi:hypothetical protein
VNARVYANTTSLSLTADIDGAEFVPPVIPAGQDIYLSFRTSKEIENTGIPDDRAVRAVSLRMGWPEMPPEQGAYQLEISLGGDTGTTVEIAYDATVAQIALAINTAIQTPLAALHPCTVTEHLDGRRIVFADNSLQPAIACEDNSLWPMSFVDIDAIEFDAGWAYMLDLRQAPVAEVTGAYTLVPSAPSVTELQPGYTEDGVSRNSIQKLTIPAEFSGGSFLLVRSTKSAPMPSPPTLDQVTAALEQIKDEGGIFVVTQVAGGIYAEFQGTMAGEPQDLIEVEVFESPGTERLLRLSTKTAGVRELLRGVDASGRIEVPMDLDFEIADPALEDVWERKVISTTVTLSRPVSNGDRNVSADLRWDQPRSRADYGRHSTDALLIGNRAMKFLIGDDDAESFPLAHNLVTNSKTFTVNAGTDLVTSAEHHYQDLDPIVWSTDGTLPAPVTAGTILFVRDATTDTYKVSLTPNGAALDLTTAGSGTHTSRLKDGTIEGVIVEVWETGGAKQRLSQESYTAAETSADLITLSGFPSTPTAGQYKALVMTYGRPATYQGHTHGIDDTPEAKQRIEDLEARVAALEAGTIPGGAPAPATSTGTLMRPLPSIWRVFRARTQPLNPGTLLGWNPFAEGSPLRDIRLLPAVHLEADNVELLPGTLPAASDAYRNRVFFSPVERTDIGGGTLPAGGYAACSGTEWYRVAREGEEGSTWYPTLFNFELFRLSISPDELALRTRLDLAFGFEMACLAPLRRPDERSTVARASLLIERGVRLADTGPGSVGSNIDTHFASPVILARHDFDLTAVPTAKRFAISVARSGSDVLTATVEKFFTPSVVSPPASADFVLRARLARFDVEDLPLDGRGIIPIRGLDVGVDGAPDNALGRYTIG